MSGPNGHANESGSSGSAVAPPAVVAPSQSAPEQIRKVVAELELPFEPSVVEWRVTNTSNNRTRGQVLPYADQRAYSDRLNKLFSPGGWTRKYSVQTSVAVQRDKDRGAAAKVLVTCELTIFAIGTNSGTGEEWSDNENALTAAEAQAFKRACSCFGLGRYFYDIEGEWVDLDQNKRPKRRPNLPAWATPEGWLKGLRPNRCRQLQSAEPSPNGKGGNRQANGRDNNGSHKQLIAGIEQLQSKIGCRMYRALLKQVAGVWSPHKITDPAVHQQVLLRMESAARGFSRLHAVCARMKPEALHTFYKTLNAPLPMAIEDMATLKRVVLALEREAESARAN